MRRQVGENLLYILGPDRRAKLVDHLVDGLFPASPSHERRVHENVVEAVAGGAGGGGEVATRAVNQSNALLAGCGAAAGERGSSGQSAPECRAPHATSTE